MSTTVEIKLEFSDEDVRLLTNWGQLQSPRMDFDHAVAHITKRGFADCLKVLRAGLFAQKLAKEMRR